MYMIDVNGLMKRFGTRSVVNGLSLRVAPGEIVGIIGANGGGKSTALRLLAGLMLSDAGTGCVAGCDLRTQSREIRKHVGYLAQHCTLYPTLSVRENLHFRAALFGMDSAARAAEEQIQSFGLEQSAKAAVSILSGGSRRRADLAAALIHSPKLLLLDEPTVGLDIEARRFIWDRLLDLAAHGTTLVFSTHDFLEAQRCHRVLLIREGETPTFASSQRLAALFNDGITATAVRSYA